jgi:hypothetical protein
VRILSIDPGSKESAMITLVAGEPERWQKWNNCILIDFLRMPPLSIDHLVIESMVSYGQVVGDDVFETCRWIGRFEEVWLSRGGSVSFLRRAEVKKHVAESASAKDSGVRESLIRRWGGQEVAIGGAVCRACNRKKRAMPGCMKCLGTGDATPKGPLHGIASDVWSALAIAVTYHDLHAAPVAGRNGVAP